MRQPKRKADYTPAKWAEVRERDRARYPKRREALREASLRRAYGIGLVELHEILKRQKHACGICRKKFAHMEPRPYHVDHDHASGKVRGILCGQCNVAEGMIGRTGLSVRQWSALAKDYLRWPPAAGLGA